MTAAVYRARPCLMEKRCKYIHRGARCARDTNRRGWFCDDHSEVLYEKGRRGREHICAYNDSGLVSGFVCKNRTGLGYTHCDMCNGSKRSGPARVHPYGDQAEGPRANEDELRRALDKLQREIAARERDMKYHRLEELSHARRAEKEAEELKFLEAVADQFRADLDRARGAGRR